MMNGLCKTRLQINNELVPAISPEDLRAWLKEQATSHDYRWLFAHADDGVIWGYLNEAGELILSGDVYNDPVEYPSLAVKLHPATLQQARLFGPKGELFIWRASAGLDGRTLEEGQGDELEFFESFPLLWGTELGPEMKGFSVLVEGQQGLMHAPPLPATGIEGAAAGLVVRNYVDYEKGTGQAYVAFSRLVDLVEEGTR